MDIALVFFFYGLAFFTLGVAMLLEAGREPLLAEGYALRLLACFGLAHACHEWLEMVLMRPAAFGVELSAWVQWARLGLLAFSFSFLIAFGLALLKDHPLVRDRRLLAGLALFGIFFAAVALTQWLEQPDLAHGLAHADAWARYTLAVPGAFLASLALFRKSRADLAKSRRDLALDLELAAGGFFIYSLSQLVVSPLEIFPARVLNIDNFLRLAGFPIQVVRVAAAVVISLAMVHAVKIMDQERRRMLSQAQETRLQALEAVQKEMQQREAMRRELLRRMVIAQEEERARVARELHDEFAQFITAASLNLASLRESLPRQSEQAQVVARLQGLLGQATDSVLRLIRDLRPSQLDDLGLAAGLQTLADEACRSLGLEVHMELQGERRRLDPYVETVLFRIGQEALVNAARHAAASRAFIRLEYLPNEIRLSVTDKGVGFSPDQEWIPPRGLGLAGMRERAESAGGRLWIRSAPGKGTEVLAVIPSNHELAEE